MNAREGFTAAPQPDPQGLQVYANDTWEREIVPALTDYIAVPAKSPAYDAQWAEHGYIERIITQAAAWVDSKRALAGQGLSLEIIRIAGRTPVLFFDLPATRAGNTDTVLMYGHLDKQPEFSGWRGDLGPWTPKLIGDKLYGRGGADDGYAVYASLTAVLALDKQGVPRPRVVGLIETCEESGSYDLPAYVDALRPRLGDVSLVVCLDSGCGDYERLWLTTSLRGLVAGTLSVEVLDEGVHSGDASGVVPSSFRVMRQLLDRLEDSATGRLLPASFHCNIPQDRELQAEATAAILGDEVWKRFPWACGADGTFTLPTTTDPKEALLNRTWRPTLSITGAEGIPAMDSAGNVLRPRTAFKLSLRLPPLVDAQSAVHELKALLERDAPYNARVQFTPDKGAATGWNNTPLQPWLQQAMQDASRASFGQDLGYIGQGGTIPLMNLLQQQFPKSQHVVCGVLGPKSNAHGPNEFLHVAYAKKLTAAVAQIIARA